MKLIIAGLVLLILAFGAVLAVGGYLVAPALRPVGDPPAWLAAEPVAIPTDGSMTHGWLAMGPPDRPGVVLLHAVRSDRRSMLGRARSLREAGYSLLLIDLQAHGETAGEAITFGVREAAGVHAAVDYLRERVGGQPVGVIGVSLGGAAALLGPAPVDVDALVLESVYATIDQAIANRLQLRFGRLGRYLAPLLSWQIEPRLGIARYALAPVTAIGRLDAPVLLISGDRDRHTLPQESERLFQAARAPKALWLVDGARHQDLHAFVPTAYEERVLTFFATHLGKVDR